MLYHTSHMVDDLYMFTDNEYLAQANRPGILIHDMEGGFVRFGLGADKYKHYKALTGDTVRGIPGVRGMSSSGAFHLVRIFGNSYAVMRKAMDARDDEPRIASHLKIALVEFGMGALTTNLAVISITTDWWGVRAEILKAAEKWRPADPEAVGHYMRENEMQTEGFPESMAMLHRPTFDLEGVRVPIIKKEKTRV